MRKPDAHPEIVDAPDQRILRLRHQGLTERVIARMIGVNNGACMVISGEPGLRG